MHENRSLPVNRRVVACWSYLNRVGVDAHTVSYEPNLSTGLNVVRKSFLH